MKEYHTNKPKQCNSQGSKHNKNQNGCVNVGDVNVESDIIIANLKFDCELNYQIWY